MTRPILALDVDGVLNADEEQPGWRDADAWAGSQRYTIRYNPAHGEQLLAVAEETGAELTWLTTWENLANTQIRHLVGLPELPVIPLAPGHVGEKFSEHRSSAHVKALALKAYQPDRPVCWLEDESAVARIWTMGYPSPWHVVEVDDKLGLQDHHIEAARQWLLSIRQG